MLKCRGFDLLVGGVLVKFDFETSGRGVLSISENRLLAWSMFGNERHIRVSKCRRFDLLAGNVFVKFDFATSGRCVFVL